MVWVNLLPWRERWLASQRRRWLKGLLLPLMLPGVIALAGMLQHQFNALKAIENQAWRQSQTQLKHALARRAALQRLIRSEQATLERLERRHRRLMGWQQLMNTLDARLPPGLWLTAISGDAQAVIFTGRCTQVEESTLFRSALQSAGLFDRLTITHLKRAAGGSLDFTLTGRWAEAGRDD
ncbi:hypothetical protein BTJ39_13660 [Izhakiella australiensis]|uniref:Fimbrial assembly protein n=1 Tax=Izhakiella australiensis TaxID=1926881 RepID=A0A1S8YKD2_9GAMM|nr:PilN domain-containing protein [Izhakiella australiensis]OON39325.1 hypothetical protein BTJ39_13660 [Izhakiella australiensis]